MSILMIGRRTYEVETRPSTFDERGFVYVLRGLKGAVYYTIRNRPNPHMMFLVNESGPLSKGAPKVWLTDKDGTLRVCGR